MRDDDRKEIMKEYIRSAMLSLLREKDYADIQMTEIAARAHIGRRSLYRYFRSKDNIMKNIAESLMDRFADMINEKGFSGLDDTMLIYFRFWEENMDTLQLLKKTHLTGVIEDRLPQLIMGVALKTKFKGMDIDIETVLKQTDPAELYGAYYIWAGIWKLPMCWSEEQPPRPAAEMAALSCRIISNKE